MISSPPMQKPQQRSNDQASRSGIAGNRFVAGAGEFKVDKTSRTGPPFDLRPSQKTPPA